MRVFSERLRSRRMAAVAAACVALFGLPGHAQAVAGPSMLRGLPWSIVGVGDLNNDVRADIVWHNANTNETEVWAMNGQVFQHKQTVRNENGQLTFVGPPWSIVGVGDIGGGGIFGANRKADIVWHNANTNETQIWFMNDHRIAQRATVVGENGQPTFVGLPWSIVGVGDLNGAAFVDGRRADIVWHNANTNETQVWFMDNAHIIQRATVLGENGQPIFVGPPWSIVGLGDLGLP